MDCRSCGVVNAPGRRYCRECGTRLGRPCAVCHFFNAVEDKHCGGCGHRLKTGAGSLAADFAPEPARAMEDAGAAALTDLEGMPPAKSTETGIDSQGVSQSEIDGLFENILDGEPDESEEISG